MAVVRDGGGKFVWSGLLESESSTINVSDWASGLYTVEVLDESSNKRFRSSLIVE